MNGRREVKRLVRRRRFAERPRMPIDADHSRRSRAGARPRGARRTGAAAEIDKRIYLGSRRRKPIDDVRKEEEVERAVEQRKGRALASSGKRRPFRELLPALDIRGGQGPQGARHFREGQRGKMFCFECGDPASESGIEWAQGSGGGVSPASAGSYMQDAEIIFTDFTPR